MKTSRFAPSGLSRSCIRHLRALKRANSVARTRSRRPRSIAGATQYGGLQVGETKRLKALEEENRRLKKTGGGPRPG